jgi:hypothetical protein
LPRFGPSKCWVVAPAAPERADAPSRLEDMRPKHLALSPAPVPASRQPLLVSLEVHVPVSPEVHVPVSPESRVPASLRAPRSLQCHWVALVVVCRLSQRQQWALVGDRLAAEVAAPPLLARPPGLSPLLLQCHNVALVGVWRPLQRQQMAPVGDTLAAEVVALPPLARPPGLSPLPLREMRDSRCESCASRLAPS